MKKLIDGVVQESNIFGVPLTVSLLPEKSLYSNYKKVIKTFITIHETGNSSTGAGAKTHNNYLRNLTDRNVSWEFSVDDKEIYQNMKTTVPTYHAGTIYGNENSIGVEICVNKDGNFEKAKENAIKLVAYLIFNCDGLIPRITVDNLKATITGHFEWIDKQCPSQILKQSGGFLAFQQKIIDFILANQDNNSNIDVDKIIADLKIELENSNNLKEEYKKQVNRLIEENKSLLNYKTDLLNIVNSIKKYLNTL